MSDPVRKTIARSAARCFAAFCDARRLPVWVPGLRRARVIISGEDGLPREVLFEFGDKLTYSLLYSYDEARRRVEWRPGVGRLDAVAGFAEFSDREAGCEMSYTLAPTGDRPSERHNDAETIAGAFVRWMQSEPV